MQSHIPEVHDIKISDGGLTQKDQEIRDLLNKKMEGLPWVFPVGEIQWSERVRALLLAQPLNPLQVLEFKPL